MLNNFHHHRALSGRLFFRNTPKSFNFARSKKPNTRQNSDRSSKRTQTDSTESTFSREWKQRKTGAYYILAAFILTGGTVYYYQHYSKVSESSCETEVDVPEKETRKKYGWKKTADTLNSLQLQEAITQATDLCQRVKDESGAPGLVVAVSVDGRPVWTEGMGYADIENRLPCKPESVICIASISKPLTMTAIAKAVENGDLDLDKPVQVYVPQYPENTLDGKKVTMTTRQLVSHLGGVRHYSKKYISKTPPPQSDDSASASESEMKKKKEEKESTSSEKASTSNQPAEFKQEEEYYIKDKYESTEAALALFKDDPLVHKPGSKFLYTTHAWTLLAAVLEGATKTKYPVLIRQLFHDLGLSSTYLNDSEPLIYHRVRNYIRNKKGRLVNAPYVDCSYKYAGGGILSTMSDLVHFGDAMLYSYQYQGLSTNEKETKAVTVKKADSPSYNNNNNNNNNNNKTTGTPLLPGYLQASTVEELWTPVKLAKMNRTTFYGMGWMMPAKKTPTIGFGRKDRMYVYHTGGASLQRCALAKKSEADTDNSLQAAQQLEHKHERASRKIFTGLSKEPTEKVEEMETIRIRLAVLIVSYYYYYYYYCSSAVIAQDHLARESSCYGHHTDDLEAGLGLLAEQRVVVTLRRSSVSLPCMVATEPQFGNLTYMWRFKGDKIQSRSPKGRRYTYPNGTLHIRKVVHRNKAGVRISDEGMYECFVTNSVGTVVAQRIRLVVASLGKSFLAQPSSGKKKVGDNLYLPCQIHALPDDLLKVWQKDGTALKVDGNPRYRPTPNGLLILNARLNDSGTYHCQVTNKNFFTFVHDDTPSPLQWRNSQPASIVVAPVGQASA
ncbi:hypothetical protein ACOMHN_041957 [Nucella lapillus]